MGSEEEEAHEDEQPIHEVQLSDFKMGKYPVTQALWKAVMGQDNNPSYFPGDNRPVEWVSWNDAQQFIEKLNQQTGENYRLPTEAEWEYAARGGQKSRMYKYAGSNHLEEVGWFDENSHFETKPVGLKDPNELGLYDMSGNVDEWCLDWYSGNYYEKCKQDGLVVDPKGPKDGPYRVLRGGGWDGFAGFCRSTFRDDFFPESGSRFGFRLVLSLQSVG